MSFFDCDHPYAKKYDGVDVMDGNAPGTAAVQTQSPSGAVRITVPGKKSETRPAQLKGVPIGHFIGEGAPLLTTALSGATTTTYSTPHGSQTLITVESDKALRDYRFPLALAAGSTAKVEADGSIPWPVLALTGAELQVLAGLSAAVFVGGTWVGCTFSKLTGWIATVVNLICRVSGASGAISAIGIISGAFRGASLVATKCYGINLSKPSAPLRDMPGRDCGF
ncbi:hypothetical protein [Arthrobacter bambusae]|uniref:Uncharacterized protein n=1 Tax=Arthrobacter bambusae TaxID=1338426 RepID=A0AAW8D6X0_9MICC|nr:hypothetical protein [Arthrobacter bambusae]MDP9903638.1 hypothetical protein [Arthrobacter bambusae]MDQ0128368.1 hypothetical protein [Arthrobacter bambusae]MDQ0179709.1 hypothetical protein [Arthrobacter bambusae]